MTARPPARRPLKAGSGPARDLFSPPLQPELLLLPAGETPVRWNRCRRARRVSLRIDPRAGNVVVTLPPRASREAGLALLHAHADWVAGRLAALPGRISFSDGALIPLGGTLHLIRHDPSARRGVWIQDGEIRVSGEIGFLPRRVSDFLRLEARLRLSDLVQQIGAPLALLPRRLSIKDTATRWGSCSSEGVVMFSWRLVMAPAEIQHYVVAHELAHLRHLDHGRAFWTLVDALTPFRLPAETWLKRKGPTLLRTG